MHNFHLSRRRLLCDGAMLATAVAAPFAWAQQADRPVRIIVGAPAGGTSDLVARVVGDALSRNLGQPVFIDNKPGALGAIAMATPTWSPSTAWSPSCRTR